MKTYIHTLEHHNKKRICNYCGSELIRTRSHSDKAIPSKHVWTRQHIIPARRGGNGRYENLKICCKECNMILAIMGDCPAMLFCMRSLGEKFGLGNGNDGAKGAYKKLNLKREMFE
jgi:hypothetical protein